MALALGIPASADIRAFNEKVKVQDYKGAAAEAAATWPTLDKSRKDIALIAREFGFSTYMAGDFAGAQTFAKFAADNEAAGPAGDLSRATSMVLYELAGHAEKHTADTRNSLLAAVRSRAALPGVDNITYLGFEAVVTHDFQYGKWADAAESAQLAATATEQAGPTFTLRNRRFRLFGEVAEYMRSYQKESYDRLDALVKAVRADVNNAPTESEAQSFVDLYWDAHAWKEAFGLHLVASRKMKSPDEAALEEAKKLQGPPTDRDVRLLGIGPDMTTCRYRVGMSNKPNYPPSAMYAGMAAVVVLRMDVDKDGRTSNHRMLAAVPERDFGTAVMRAAKQIRYFPDKPWDASCSLEHKGRVMTFQFVVRPA